MYSQQDLDSAILKERERCIEQCKKVMERHIERAKKSEDHDESFCDGASCGAEDCIEAINGAWDDNR